MVDQAAIALAWVDWFNMRQLLGPIENVPAAEYGRGTMLKPRWPEPAGWVGAYPVLGQEHIRPTQKGVWSIKVPIGTATNGNPG